MRNSTFVAILLVLWLQHDHSAHAPKPAQPAQQHDHSAHAHAGTAPPRDVIPPGGLWGPVPGAGPAPAAATPSLPLAAAPRSTGDMATVNPAGTVVMDDHDRPVAASVNEAQKSNGGGHHH